MSEVKTKILCVDFEQILFPTDSLFRLNSAAFPEGVADDTEQRYRNCLKGEISFEEFLQSEQVRQEDSEKIQRTFPIDKSQINQPNLDIISDQLGLGIPVVILASADSLQTKEIEQITQDIADVLLTSSNVHCLLDTKEFFLFGEIKIREQLDLAGSDPIELIYWSKSQTKLHIATESGWLSLEYKDPKSFKDTLALLEK